MLVPFVYSFAVFRLNVGSLYTVLIQSCPHQFLHKQLFKSLTVPKNAKDVTLGFFIIQVTAENQNNQTGGPMLTSRNFGKSQCRNKTVKLSELFV